MIRFSLSLSFGLNLPLSPIDQPGQTTAQLAIAAFEFFEEAFVDLDDFRE